MRYVVFIMLLVFLLPAGISAQEDGLSFRSGELQMVSERLTGNVTYWPVLLELADHNTTENSFYLNAEDLQILRNLSDLNVEFESQRKRINELVNSGAAIFAEKELNEVQQMIRTYRGAAKEGNVDLLFETGQGLRAAIDHTSDVLNANRIADIEAQIERKQGTVEKRQGLLGSWAAASRGDMLKQSDGIKTLQESFASLAFADGSAIKVDPNTVAVIRKSRIDRLSDNTDTEITLENGGVLARLSAAGKERSNYIINAGSSSTELRSRNFYAEADSGQTVKLTNYDGEASVNSNDVVITIGKNEGTIVKSGEAPLPARKLLPAPVIPWSSPDTVISSDRLLFRYSGVDGAASYRVEYGSDNNFAAGTEQQILTGEQLVLEDLPDGVTYVRVQSVDSLGLRGPFSNTVRILRSDDRKAPPVIINESYNDILFTLNSRRTITGITEPNVRLSVSGDPVAVSSTGKFSFTLTDLTEEHDIQITVTDRSGNSTDKELRVVRLREDDLFELNLNGASGADPIVFSQNQISISGQAYPGLKFILENNNFLREIRTDLNGKWGATLYPTEGILKITIIDAGTSKEYFNRSIQIRSE